MENFVIAPDGAVICPDCNLWPCKGSDRFCSLCGFCRIEELQIHVNTTTPGKEAARPFHLTNTKEVRGKFSVAECPPWLDSHPREVVLDGKQDCQIRLVVKLDELGGVPFQQGFVTYCDENGESAKEVKVEVWPWPQVTFHPLELVRGKTPEKASLAVRVGLAPFTILSSEFTPSFLKAERNLFLELGEGTIPVAIDLPEGVGARTHTLSYRLSVAGLGSLSGELQVRILEPAKIDIKEEPLEITLIPDDEETLSLTLLNRGEEPLEIYGIEVGPPQPTDEKKVSLSFGGVEFPFKILGSEERTIDLRISSARDARPAEYTFQLHFQSNALSEGVIPLYVTVSDEEYPGSIAIDYGTTDSAVACLTSQRAMGLLRPANIPLEGQERGSKIYSNIFFMDYVPDREIPFVWCIGETAKVFGQGDRRRLVKAIKTKVGKNYQQQVDLEGTRFELPAEEIVKFIYMDILKRTRKRLKQRPVNLLLSIPTRFTLIQKLKLQEAFAQALQAMGLETAVKPMVVDESLAAGMFYIVIRAPKEEQLKTKPRYTLIVVDFGGGTTDVTLFQVDQRLGAHGVEGIEQVEVLGAWGDEQMGGEDVSWEIARLLAERFLGRKVDEQRDLDQIRELEDEAEAAKVAISELMTLARQPQDSLTLQEAISPALRANLTYLQGIGNLSDEEIERIIKDYSVNSSNRNLQVLSKDHPGNRSVVITEEEVANIFKRKLEALKAELLLLLARANLERADVLLLAGQSSLFPLVGETLQELATVVDHVKDENGELVLKESVSRGALLLELHDLSIKGRNCLWARLGRLTPGFGGTPIVFKELIPWGFAYPGESEPFPLARRDIRGRRALLELHENLTLSEQPRSILFRRYEWVLPDEEEGEPYLCKLSVDKRGQVEAFCRVKGNWEKGRVTGGG